MEGFSLKRASNPFLGMRTRMNNVMNEPDAVVVPQVVVGILWVYA